MEFDLGMMTSKLQLLESPVCCKEESIKLSKWCVYFITSYKEQKA
jgi:hypothetical protein